MPTRTIFLSKLIGLGCILVVLSMLTHKQESIETLAGLLHNPPMLFLTGVITVTVGLAIVLSHNVWSGGALPVVVTLVGWGTLFKGMLFLFLTPQTESEFFFSTLHYEQFFYAYSVISLLLGIYLTYAGYAGGHGTAPRHGRPQ
jgi:hypothetical protein